MLSVACGRPLLSKTNVNYSISLMALDTVGDLMSKTSLEDRMFANPVKSPLHSMPTDMEN